MWKSISQHRKCSLLQHEIPRDWCELTMTTHQHILKLTPLSPPVGSRQKNSPLCRPACSKGLSQHYFPPCKCLLSVPPPKVYSIMKINTLPLALASLQAQWLQLQGSYFFSVPKFLNYNFPSNKHSYKFLFTMELIKSTEFKAKCAMVCLPSSTVFV